MKLLQKHNHAVLIFGLGLVGRGIFNQLNKDFDVVAGGKLEWGSIEKCQDSVETLCKEMLSPETRNIDIIWSAGNTLFSVDAVRAKADLEFFRTLTNSLGKSLNSYLPKARKRYVLISSAGGLFEGQTGIKSGAVPRPIRPYGELKLSQEVFIKNQMWIDEYSLVRLSSVYSITNLNSRMGLVPIMMTKAIRQEVLTVYGSEMTLRDYVLDQDVGRYIAKIIRGALPEMVFIVDGKPYSILELKNMVEAITRKKVYLNYTLSTSNAANNSYSNTIRASGFEPTDMASNIRILYHNLLSGKPS